MSWAKASIESYKITVREPGWETASILWEKFSEAAKAEEFIKEIAPTYPEGTLLWVTAIWTGHPRWAPSGMTTRKSFVVNSFGEATPRKSKWVPEGTIAREWVKELPEIEIPPEPEEPKISIGYSEGEKVNLRQLLRVLGAREEDEELSSYRWRKEEVEARKQQAEEFPKRDYFKPEELRNAKDILRKILGEERDR